MRGRFRGCAHSPFIGGDILIPAILVILMKNPTYGYSLIEELGNLGIDVSLFHPSIIYRMLRMMEVEGLVTSNWDIRDIGPARRVYTITDLGKSFLKNWGINAKENLKIVEKLIKAIEEGGE
ncbi:MAG: PadR family transcriptional regulator [bacterium]